MSMYLWTVTHKRHNDPEMVIVAATTAPKAIEAAAFVVRKKYYGSSTDILTVARGVVIERIAK